MECEGQLKTTTCVLSSSLIMLFLVIYIFSSFNLDRLILISLLVGEKLIILSQTSCLYCGAGLWLWVVTYKAPYFSVFEVYCWDGNICSMWILKTKLNTLSYDQYLIKRIFYKNRNLSTLLFYVLIAYYWSAARVDGTGSFKEWTS